MRMLWFVLAHVVLWLALWAFLSRVRHRKGDGIALWSHEEWAQVRLAAWVTSLGCMLTTGLLLSSLHWIWEACV